MSFEADLHINCVGFAVNVAFFTVLNKVLAKPNMCCDYFQSLLLICPLTFLHATLLQLEETVNWKQRSDDFVLRVFFQYSGYFEFVHLHNIQGF